MPIRTNAEIIELIDLISDCLRGRSFTKLEGQKLRNAIQHLQFNATETTSHLMESN